MYLGTSIAISWAWGTSLILGLQIAQEKGLGAFSIWATANVLTLILFGTLYKKEIITPKVLDTKVVKIFTNLIQIFCLIIQLKILGETLQHFFSPTNSYLLTMFMGIGLVLWMYRKGLSASIFTDLFQGILTLSILVIMLVYCSSNYEPVAFSSSTTSDITWGIWSACILLSGIMTDIQHWQRAEVNNKGYAFECASIFFACYLGIILLLSAYQFNHLLNILLLIAVIGVTTSTIDSIAVALHRDFGKKWGTLISLSICIGYGLLLKLSVLNLWSYFGVIRVALAVYILTWCFKYNEHNSRKLNSNS